MFSRRYLNGQGQHLVISFGLPHSVPLVALSVLLAALGGYVGLGLAGQARGAEGMRRRALLAGAAWALGLGIWTMHFVGILAARFPGEIRFSIFMTLLSFLLCVLVVGVAAFLRSRSAQGNLTTMLSAVFMGAGIVSMHYVGMHALSGPFSMHHDAGHAVAATLLAVVASYAALKLSTRRLQWQALAVSSTAFGLAVSGMHYTAMAGMTLTPGAAADHRMGPAISSDALTITVAVLAFLISAVFLLYLVPESDRQRAEAAAVEPMLPPNRLQDDKPAHMTMIPVETEGTTRLLAAESICAIQATTHYTLAYDGQREYFSPWSITEAQQKLAGLDFMRVHRSHIIALDKVSSLRRAGDGAAVEVGQPLPRVVPVSRSHYAELKSRLGLRQKLRGHIAAQ